MSVYYASIADNIADNIAATILLLRRVNALYYEEAFSIRIGPSTGPDILQVFQNIYSILEEHSYL